MEDAQIVELYCKRNQEAIVQTKEKYEPYCFTIATNILSSREDSEECVSDTWLHTWNSIPPKQPARLQAFVGAITRNLSIDRYRRLRAKKRGEGVMESILEELSQCTSSSGVEEQISHKLLLESIERFLKKQSVEKRVIFVRRYWYMDDLKDVAERMKMKEAKVKTILFRMRSQLKDHLAEEEIWI